MKTGLLKTLWLISGVLLIFAGVLSFIYKEQAIYTLTVVLGLIMLISGLFDVACYLFTRNEKTGSGWVLADGILTVIFSAFVIGNQAIATNVVPFIFAMWILFSGVSRLISSLDLQKQGIKGWGWLMLMGIGGIVLGVISFLKPIAVTNVIGLLMGFIFIFQGAASIFMYWFLSKMPSE